MSGRTPSRLGAVVALVAAVAFAAGFVGIDTAPHLLDFNWGAPAASSTVDIHSHVEAGVHAAR